MLDSVKNQGFSCSLRAVLLLFLSLSATRVQAVIAVDNVSSVVGASPTSLVVSHTTGAGADRLMIVGVSFNNDDFETVTAVTYNGTGLTFVGQISRNDDSRVELWSYLNPPAVTANVVVTFNEVVQQGAGAGVITFTGIDQTTPYGVFQSNTGISASASMIAISAPGETLLGVMAAERQDSNPVAAGGTARWTYKTQGGNNRTAGAGATFAGGPSVNLTWNLNEPDDWVVGAISLRDANPPTSTGFCDDFESGLGNWTVNTLGGGSAGINGDTFNSAGNSLFTRWGAVSVTTTNAVAAQGLAFQLSAWIRRGDDSFSENPEGAENLLLEYFNNVGTWVTLETFVGGGTPGEIFERTYALPADARHDNLHIRIQQTGGSGTDWDYWHVDDLCILELVQPEIEFRMDELQWNGSANEVVDSSGNANDANAAAGSGLTTVNPGQICRAGDFDGVDDYIQSNDIFSLLRTTASLSFWIKTTQTGNNVGWQAPGIAGVELSGGSDDIFWGWLDAGGRIGISVANDFSTKSTVAINDGTYHHVVLTRDAVSGAYKIYLDGVLDNSGTLASGIIGTNFSSIGRIEDTGGTPEYFQGDLDELLVFNSVLSDGAVASIYASQSGGRNLDGSVRVCAGELAYFRLDADAGVWNGSAGEVLEQSGNFSGAFALGTGAGVDTVPARVCRGIDIPFNNTNAAQYGFDTTVDIDADVGNRGTISFWYNSDNNWVGGGDRMLADASPDDLPGADKYFYVVLRNNGRLRFALEDSVDADFTFQTAVNNILANTWTHIAVTWDMAGSRQIYLNGTLAATDASATNGQLASLRTLYVGDNRSTYHPGATANSADGIIDEVRVYARVQSAAEIITDSNATHSCSSSLTDHLSISHDGTGINCQAETVTLSAHTAVGHAIDTAYTGTVNISVNTGNGDWSYVGGGNPANLTNSGSGNATYVFDGSENGSVDLALSNLVAETVNINLNDGSYSETSGGADASDDPNLNFVTAGFNFLADNVSNAIGTQIAGKPSDQGHGAQLIEIEAVETDPSGNCVAAIDGNEMVGLAFICENPNTCSAPARPLFVTGSGPTVAVPGFDFGTSPAHVPVQLNFAGARASLVMNYVDAGQIQLDATFTTPNGFILTGGSNSFVARPFGFHIDVPHPSMHATNASEGILTSAGTPFTVNVSGELWNSADDDLGAADGIPDNHDDTLPGNNDSLNGNSVSGYSGTPNFGQENEDIALTSLLFAPGGGNDPGLPAGTQILIFNNGAGSNAAVTFDEVGIIEIAAAIADSDYLGIGAVETARMLSKSGYVGRFTPASLEITNPIDGEFEHANLNLAGDHFTYIGQDFGYASGQVPSFDVTARNLGGMTTENYTGSFAKWLPTSVDFSQPTKDAVKDRSDMSDKMMLTYTSGGVFIRTDNGDGTHEFAFHNGDTFNYDKVEYSEVSPFEQNIDLLINSVTDADGITTAADATLKPSAPLTPAGRQIRFGRIRMENAHGTELADLIMNYYIEYFDLIGGTPTWLRHNDLDTNIIDDDIAADPGSLTSATGVVGTLPGVFEITLMAPDPPATGVETITIELINSPDPPVAPWLQYDWTYDTITLYDDNPSAEATFGIYDGNPVQIYIQQIYDE